MTMFWILAVATAAVCIFGWYVETRKEFEEHDWIDPKHDRPELDAPKTTRPQRGSRSWE